MSVVADVSAPQYLQPNQDIDHYVRSIRGYKILSAEEEHELAVKLYEEGDLEAAKHLVLSHLRFVIHIAKSYAGYGLPLIDLIQEGNIGLMKAVRKFNPKKGVRIISFAVHWIKSEIHAFVIRNWRIVRIATTKAQRKLFYNLRSAKNRLGWLNNEATENLADELGVTSDQVREMECRLSGQDYSFEQINDSDDSTYAPEHYLEDEEANPEIEVSREDAKVRSLKALSEALKALDGRSQDIISQRWLGDGKKVTLQDLAEKYSISLERVRQIESKAMKQIRQHILV